MKMKKYNCYALIDASKFAGTVEAENLEEAEKKAEALEESISVDLCHQCGDEIEIGDFIKWFIEEDDG